MQNLTVLGTSGRHYWDRVICFGSQFILFFILEILSISGSCKLAVTQHTLGDFEIDFLMKIQHQQLSGKHRLFSLPCWFGDNYC